MKNYDNADVLISLHEMESEGNKHGYIAYIVYLISTWLCCWDKFDSDEVDREYEDRVWPYVKEYLKEYDDINISLVESVNNFMRIKTQGEN